MLRAYFNYVYNPVYDRTTARLERYSTLQKRCIEKLELAAGNSILCVGIGTGNELTRMFQANRDIEVTGIDFSQTALNKAEQKATALGKAIKTQVMDAHHLEFPPESFDRVLCFHVMDFVTDVDQVSAEILRVVKTGGKFVITYPSGKEGLKSSYGLFKDGLNSRKKGNKPAGLSLISFLGQMWMGVVYLPLLFRPKRKCYSREQLEKLLTTTRQCTFHIDIDPVYQDFIVYGTAT
ncbi:MAG: class I SAM-dependent methyltransferase [Chloroflexota bacterium]